MLERWLHREKIKAIHKKDLESILSHLGILDNISAGKVQCSKCGKVITIDNIQCILLENDEIKLCCNNLDCYKSIIFKDGVM